MFLSWEKRFPRKDLFDEARVTAKSICLSKGKHGEKWRGLRIWRDAIDKQNGSYFVPRRHQTLLLLPPYPFKQDWANDTNETHTWGRQDPTWTQAASLNHGATFLRTLRQSKKDRASKFSFDESSWGRERWVLRRCDPQIALCWFY